MIGISICLDLFCDLKIVLVLFSKVCDFIYSFLNIL